MPLKASQAMQDAADSLLRLPIIQTMTENSFYLALAIVVVICLIVMFVFRGTENNTYKVIRVMFWSFLTTVSLLLLRDRVNALRAESQEKQGAYDEVFEERPDLVQGNGTPDHVRLRRIIEDRANAIADKRDAAFLAAF